jgi:hypothetical protein
MPQHLLRRQEPGQAEVLERQPARRGRPPDPEVRQPRPVLCHEDVQGVKVPVHHTRRMNVPQPLGQPSRQPQPGGQLQPGQPLVLTHPLGQRRAFDMRHRQPRHVAVQIRVDDRRHEGPVHLPGRGHIGPETGPEPGIASQIAPDDPYLDFAPARRTAQVHLSQPVPAQLSEQLVRPDRTRHVRRKWRYQPDPHSRWQLEPTSHLKT